MHDELPHDELPQRMANRQRDALPPMSDDIVRGLQLILDSASMELGEKLQLQVDQDDLPALIAATSWLADVVGTAQLSD
jgi:hypothetical protein